MSWVQIPPEATHFSFFHLPQVSFILSFFLSFLLSISRYHVEVCYKLHVYLVSVNLFTQVYEMFDLDLASWAALVAQLVRALSGVQSVVGSNPT